MTDSPASPLRDPREIWDQHFAEMQQGRANWRYDAWLERWQSRFAPGSRVVDLGCGNGDDTRFLLAHGCRVTAADFSFQALRLVQQAGVAAGLLQLDLRQGIPLARGAFDAVIANLSLHYFSWPLTVDLLAQVRGLLRPGGLLLARFNSTHDANYAAERNPPVERNVFVVRGVVRRYVDAADLQTLFAPGWRVLHQQEMSITRFQSPKVLWEVVAAVEGLRRGPADLG